MRAAALQRKRDRLQVRSSRATGELRHILREGERRELESLDHGEIRMVRADDVRRRELEADGECSLLDYFAGFGGKRVRTEQSLSAALADELDEPVGVARGLRPWHVLERQDRRLYP